MKLIFVLFTGIAIGVLLTDFVVPPTRNIIQVIPVADIPVLTINCPLFGGRGAITVKPPTPTPTIERRPQ